MPTPSMQINPRLEDERAAFVLASSEAIEAAAKAISACMDYPWEHMPEQGRKTMRQHAETVISAALSAAALNGADAGVSEKPSAWLHYAPKKPQLRRVDFSPTATVEERGNGWVTVALAPLPSAPTQGVSHGK